MLLISAYLLVSLTITADFSGTSMSAANVVMSGKDDTATARYSPQQVPVVSSSRAAGVARSRQFRRAFKRSLVQIFGMKTRPQRQATTGGGHVPAYMRWLYEESSAGRLPAVLRHFNRHRNASPYRQKRHSQVTTNTVRSFTGRYVTNSSKTS